MQFDDKSRVEKAKKRSVVKQTEARNRVELFRHLPQYEHGTRLPDLESKLFQLGPVHPAVYQVISNFNLSCSWLLNSFENGDFISWMLSINLILSIFSCTVSINP